MREIKIIDSETKNLINQLNLHFNGIVKEEWGEYTLTFNNKIGNGTIRGIDFNWGLSYIDFKVIFNESTKFNFGNLTEKVIEFIFISEGKLYFEDENTSESIEFDRYQNIIISDKLSSKKLISFPEKTRVNANIIKVETQKYKNKKNNNLGYLDKTLRQVFEKKNQTTSYYHVGNYNLKIADEIKKINHSNETGVIRTLLIEGQLNVIMSLQILEYQKAKTKKTLPDSLSSSDIKKINELSLFIENNISETLTINSLSKISGLGPRKMQLGFKVLYLKSVNEYIRDLKLEIARDLLSSTDLSISEIVYNIGFNSRSYFSKIFFERYAILPKDYKKKNRFEESSIENRV